MKRRGSLIVSTIVSRHVTFENMDLAAQGHSIIEHALASIKGSRKNLSGWRGIVINEEYVRYTVENDLREIIKGCDMAIDSQKDNLRMLHVFHRLIQNDPDYQTDVKLEE